MNSPIRVGLIGDYNIQQKAHGVIPQVLAAAADGVESTWIPTDSSIDKELLAQFHGFWCVPGMPYKNAAGVLKTIRYARTARVPFLGTSAGFQYALIEFARNVIGLAEADHQKINPGAAVPLVGPLKCALAGVRARVRFMDGSRLKQMYRSPESVEEYHCSCGLNGRYRRLLEGGELYVAGVDDENEVRAVELDRHPFFVATLFQPELAKSDGNPVVKAFVAACERRSQGLVRAAG